MPAGSHFPTTVGERVRRPSPYVVPVTATVVPEGFIPWDHPSPVLDALGGFLRHDTDPLRIGFVVCSSRRRRWGCSPVP
jgi:hypothetical protein